MKRYMVNGSEFWYDEGKQPEGAIEIKAQAPATKEAEPGDKAQAPARKPRTAKTKATKSAAEDEVE